MLAICIEHNGNRISSVNTGGFDVLAVNLSGSRDRREFATLNFSGVRSSGGDKVSLTWISELMLHAGDVVSVSLLPPAEHSDQGKTLAELFPDEDWDGEFAMPDMDEVMREAEARPCFHDAFCFSLDSSSGKRYAGTTRPPESQFALTVLWNFVEPEQAHMSLSSTSLENVRRREAGRKHVYERMRAGSSVSFRLIASALNIN